MSPFAWLLVIGLGPLKRNATAIAAAADIQERTAQRCITLLDGGIFETYPLDPTRQLEHHVEADECDQRAGSKGLAHAVARRARAPRQHGLQRRGRATAEMGRPPLLGLVQRRDKPDQDAPAAHVSLEVREHVRSATITPIIAARVKAGAPFFTDAYTIDHCTKADDDHRTVNHGAGAYARRDPDGACGHCNTMEGVWSGLRNVLDRFKGSSQRFLHLHVARDEFLHLHIARDEFLHLHVARDEFLHLHGHLHWRQAFAAALRGLFSTPGDYLRRMAHQHRRMPLTLCYR